MSAHGPGTHPTITAAKLREAGSPRAALRARGVVHTPIELARFGLSKVHAWLREDFGLAGGIADPSVLLLDPAVGTGVWLAAALELAASSVASPLARPRARFDASGSAREHHDEARAMLGFDVDEAALETTRALLASGHTQRSVELSLRCENTLAVADPWPPGRAGVRAIVGNPPWAARSMSRGTELSDTWLAEFRRDESGAPLGERRVGVLSDDYVRFVRWALEQARTAPQGAVLCLATNGSFLDGPVHRGMRAALRQAFDRIEVVDLGGNSLLSKSSTERDENVFGVRVGAALTLAARLPGHRARHASVRVARAVGTREHKLGTLSELAWADAAEELGAPWSARRSSVQEGHTRPTFSLAEAFPFHREGVQTNRDDMATAPTRDLLLERLQRIADGSHPLVPSRHFDPPRARKVARELLADGEASIGIRRLAYRPLDVRFMCAVSPLCHRPRPDLLRATAHSSLSLLSARKDRGGSPFSLFAASHDVADACFLSTRSSCRTRVFPSRAPDGSPNLSNPLIELFGTLMGVVDPECVIRYALGVLCSARFREEQGELLKRDYPRIPTPRDRETIEAFAAAGSRAIDALHLSVDEVCARTVDWSELNAPDVDQRRMDLRHACFSSDEATVSVDGTVVLRGVSRAIWQCTVGHLPWRNLTLQRASSLPLELLSVLRRAELWLRASHSADDAFLLHFC